MKLFVAGIPNDMDDVDLKEMFELYAEIKSAKVIMDKATGKSKGFGFVEITDETEAKEAIKILNGAGFKGGKKMSVMEAQEPSRGEGGGSGGFNRSGPGKPPPRKRY